jgi:hypothetical protein
MKPRYTEDQGTESTTNGTLTWNRPTQLGMEGPRWERNFQTAGIAILWKALDVIKQQISIFPTSISDEDQDITEQQKLWRWALDKRLLRTRTMTKLKARNVRIMPHEIMWLTVQW